MYTCFWNHGCFYKNKSKIKNNIYLQYNITYIYLYDNIFTFKVSFLNKLINQIYLKKIFKYK